MNDAVLEKDVAAVPADLLKVSGDDALSPYDCAGFQAARKTELSVYWFRF